MSEKSPYMGGQSATEIVGPLQFLGGDQTYKDVLSEPLFV